MDEQGALPGWLTAVSSLALLGVGLIVVSWQLLGTHGPAHPRAASSFVTAPAAASPAVPPEAGTAPPASAADRRQHITVWLVASLAEAVQLRTALGSIASLPANQVVVATSDDETARSVAGLPNHSVIDLRRPIVYIVASADQAQQVQGELLTASRLSDRDTVTVATTDAEIATLQAAADRENIGRLAAGLAPQVLVDQRPADALQRLLDP